VRVKIAPLLASPSMLFLVLAFDGGDEERAAALMGRATP